MKILTSFYDKFSVQEAAKAYDKKALELHGEFAKLNFPQGFNEFL